jgi:hypothetical protein
MVVVPIQYETAALLSIIMHPAALSAYWRRGFCPQERGHR